MLKFIIILCSLLCSVFVSANKKPVFHHYTTEHGLSHNEVRVIRQAENGMLWLGTQNGLVSFDGYRFTVFKNKRNNSKTICGDKIYSLETSSLNGKIWVGTTVGLCVLDPLSGQSEAFPDTFQIKTNLHKTHIKFLYEDRIGYLWISASSGNYRYSIHHNTMERVFEGKNIKCVYEGREGVFWVCHDGILSRYDRNSDKIIKSYKSNIDHLYTDRFGVLWGVGQNGLYRYLPNLMEFEHLSEVKTKFNTGFNCITEDKIGRLVLGQYGGGISIYDPRLDEISHIIAKPGEVGSLSSDDVYDVYSDQAGVVWVGTQEGLDLYDWSRQRFEKWKHDPDNPKGLANSFVQYIYRDQQQNLWLGTRDGLDRYTGKDKKGMPQFEHYTLGFNQGDLHSNYIAGILVDSKKRLWAASWGNGLNVRYPNGKDWINFRHDENDSCSIASNDVISVLEDRRGRIWVGTLDGLSCLKEDKGKVCFKNYRSNSADSLSLFNHRIFKVFEDSRGRIWLASIDGGLSLMHEETDGKIWFQRFTHDPNNPKSIADNEVFVIFEDSKQRLWIGTSPKGFCRVLEMPDRKGQSNFSFISYQEKDGLPDNEINGILEDSFGFLWISTNKGISRFNPEDETFVNYSEYDGVLKGKFRKNAAWMDDDGTMYFGGTAGVNVFNPLNFPVNNIPAQPTLTGLYIDDQLYTLGDSLNGEPVFEKDADGNLMLFLTDQLNRFEVSFSAMSYSSPYKNKYRWKLEGYDTDWHSYMGNEPKAFYRNLPVGNYTLFLEASNNDGVWSYQKAQMNIEVNSQNTFYYWAVIAFVIVLIGFSLFKLKKPEATKKQKEISSEDQELIDRLNLCMAEKNLYRDYKLGLNDLADELQINPNQLSALLNEQIGKSFYDYINEFRIEEVKKRLVDTAYQNQTILSIAWDCGFNSKSAFNRIFKTLTGLTPSAYQKKYSKR